MSEGKAAPRRVVLLHGEGEAEGQKTIPFGAIFSLSRTIINSHKSRKNHSQHATDVAIGTFCTDTSKEYRVNR